MSNKDYLKIAIEQAKLSVEEGGFPAGAVIVIDAKIVAKGISIGNKLNDPTSHSESVAIREACKNLKLIDLSNAVLFSSMEPCMMCFSAANWAGIKKIVYGCKKTNDLVEKCYYEGNNDISDLNKNNNHKIELEYVPDFESEIRDLIKTWEEKN